MKKTKAFALLLAGAILISLAGCGNTEQTTEKESRNPAPQIIKPADVPSATESSDDVTAVESKPESEAAAPEAPPAEKEEEKESAPAPASEPIDTAAPTEPAPAKPDTASQPPVQNPPPKEPASSAAAESSKPADPPPSEEPKPTPPPVVTETPYVRPSAGEVEKAVAKYVNECRLAQGDTAAAVLPGLTEVARYRANQLITNFSHDEDIDACTVLKYGELVDMAQYGLPESANYYQGFNREAIAKGNWMGTAEEIGQKIAAGFKNSQGHWAYVGSSEYGYMAVGITFNPSDSHWYCCICMSSQNYGG